MVMNFGAPPRQASQVVRSSQEVNDTFAEQQRAYQAEQARIAYEMSQIAAPEQYAVNQAQQFVDSGALTDFFAQQAAINPVWNDPAKQAQYKSEYVSAIAPTLQYGGQGDAASQAFIGNNANTLGSVEGYDPAAVWDRLSGEGQAAGSAFQQQKADFDAFTANQTRQQQAYNQQAGGGFTGGIIDSSYSDPFSNQISGQNVGGLGGLGGMQNDPSMPNVAMPWQQPWGTPGFGQPGQGNSQGVGGYNPTGQQQGATQGSQWGGVFGAKNPWSPA